MVSFSQLLWLNKNNKLFQSKIWGVLSFFCHKGMGFCPIQWVCPRGGLSQGVCPRGGLSVYHILVLKQLCAM